MRLINTTTMEMQEFFDRNIPKYAILSHCWNDGEVSFEQYHQPGRDSLKGFRKVADFCLLSKRSFGLDWAWADTCCIDKRSSAELSEAINAMFRFYQRAAVCVVYLEDVTTTPEQETITVDQLQSSRWVARGWTLQELIAPVFIFFYSASWINVGIKYKSVFQPTFPEQGSTTQWRINGQVHAHEHQCIHEHLSTVTGIPKALLSGNLGIRSYSIAERLRWMSRRETSRAEDMSYCLLGILNINMPLLYGEGSDRAWLRLQEEVLRTSNDETILAWDCEDDAYMTIIWHYSILATNVSRFDAFAQTPIERFRFVPRAPYFTTNHGLAITLSPGTAMLARHNARDATIIMPLNCAMSSSRTAGKIQPLILVLAEEPCGHYSRSQVVQLNDEKSIRSFMRGFAECEPVREETIIHVHTSEDSIAACRIELHNVGRQRAVNVPAAFRKFKYRCDDRHDKYQRLIDGSLVFDDNFDSWEDEFEIPVGNLCKPM